MKEKLVCSSCGKELTSENSIMFDGQILCNDCLENKTTICDNCGERIWNDDVQGDSNTALCNNCYEYNYTHCERCGRVIHNDSAYYCDDDYPYCLDCYELLRDMPIKSYNYKPEPVFYGSGDFFMGIELEIDGAGEYDKNANSILDVANCLCEHIYCKHDGSIESGFEMVSHPITGFARGIIILKNIPVSLNPSILAASI